MMKAFMLKFGVFPIKLTTWEYFTLSNFGIFIPDRRAPIPSGSVYPHARFLCQRTRKRTHTRTRGMEGAFVPRTRGVAVCALGLPCHGRFSMIQKI